VGRGPRVGVGRRAWGQWPVASGAWGAGRGAHGHGAWRMGWPAGPLPLPVGYWSQSRWPAALRNGGTTGYHPRSKAGQWPIAIANNGNASRRQSGASRQSTPVVTPDARQCGRGNAPRWVLSGSLALSLGFSQGFWALNNSAELQVPTHQVAGAPVSNQEGHRAARDPGGGGLGHGVAVCLGLGHGVATCHAPHTAPGCRLAGSI
jgi:hypothetical protein